MNAEDYARRVICDPPLLLSNTIRAAMAEARAQALREAIEVVDNLYVPFGETPDGWRDCMGDVLAALRKLAGCAT